MAKNSHYMSQCFPNVSFWHDVSLLQLFVFWHCVLKLGVLAIYKRCWFSVSLFCICWEWFCVIAVRASKHAKHSTASHQCLDAPAMTNPSSLIIPMFLFLLHSARYHLPLFSRIKWTLSACPLSLHHCTTSRTGRRRHSMNGLLSLPMRCTSWLAQRSARHVNLTRHRHGWLRICADCYHRL